VKPLPVSVALAVLLTVALPAQDLPPWVLLLARVKQHGRATFEHIPDYVCLETVDRFEKPRNGASFRPIDTLQLEVASVGGKELFSRKGEARFHDGEVTDFAAEGLIGSGDFSATPLNLFVHDAGRITVPSEAGLSDRKTLRFEFEVSALAGAYRVQSHGVKAMVGVRGTFWVDPQSLDLLRIGTPSGSPAGLQHPRCRHHRHLPAHAHRLLGCAVAAFVGTGCHRFCRRPAEKPG